MISYPIRSPIGCPIGVYIKKLKADRPHPLDYSTHRPTPRTDNDSSLFFAALGKAEPLISVVRALTDGQTDGQTDGRTDATKYIISLASRSITIPIGGIGYVNLYPYSEENEPSRLS